MTQRPTHVQRSPLVAWLIEPGSWALIGGSLMTLEWLLKPYVGAHIRVPMAIAGCIIGLAGGVRSIGAKPKRQTPEERTYLSGLTTGCVTGVGMALLAAPLVQREWSYLGLAGLFVVMAASIVSDRKRRSYETDTRTAVEDR